MTKKHYEIAVAVGVTLISVFGFLWFAGVEDASLDSLPASAAEALEI